MICAECDVYKRDTKRDARVHTIWSKVAYVPTSSGTYAGEPARLSKEGYSGRRVHSSITIGHRRSIRSFSVLTMTACRALATGFADIVAVALWVPGEARIGRAIDKEHGDAAVALLSRVAAPIPVHLEARLAFPPIQYGAFSGERR